LRCFHEHKRLIDLINEMAQEIERLHEDNRQLRAAIGIYREVERRGGMKGERPAVIEMPNTSAARPTAVSAKRPAP
jgi:hypothetical protein